MGYASGYMSNQLKNIQMPLFCLEKSGTKFSHIFIEPEFSFSSPSANTHEQEAITTDQSHPNHTQSQHQKQGI